MWLIILSWWGLFWTLGTVYSLESLFCLSSRLSELPSRKGDCLGMLEFPASSWLFLISSLLSDEGCHLMSWQAGNRGTGGWFNIKMSSYQYRKSHCGDKAILRLSYHHNGISYTGKMTSKCQNIKLALIPPQVTFLFCEVSVSSIEPHPYVTGNTAAGL